MYLLPAGWKVNFKPVLTGAFWCILVWCGSLTLQAQNPDALLTPAQNQKLSLTQAINTALANNTEIKRALLTLQDANQQVRIAWSEVMPDIDGSATYTRNLEIPVNFLPAEIFGGEPGELIPVAFGTDNNWNGGFTVSQTLFRGEAIVGISSSMLYKAAQNENFRATTQQIVTQTRMAYYNVLIAYEELSLQQAAVERLRKNLGENRARRRAGLLDEYDVLQVEVQLNNQEPQLTQARYAVDKAHRELKLLLGLPLDLELSVEGELGTFDILSESADLSINRNIKEVDRMTPYLYRTGRDELEVAADMRGDLRILEKQDELKDREILAIKSRFLPTVTANYNMSWTAAQAGTPVFFGAKEQRARFQTVGVTVSLSLFRGFERSANLQRALIERKDIEEQREHAARSAKNEIESAKEALNQAIETAAAREKALQQAREGYRRARSRFENGLGSQLDVTNAELQLRQAELNYAQMIYNYLSAKAQYDQAVGMVPFVYTAETH